MTSRLPPLNALRVFEAVARHRSFRKAADELFVTPAAVTHQIKALEEQLGVTLFHRVNRRTDLTPAAMSALPRFQQAFRLLAEGLADLRGRDRTPQITIRATPTFASRWMMPRLQRFLRKQPHVDVRLLASGRLINAMATLSSEAAGESTAEIDVDIQFSDARPAGDFVDLLLEVGVVPMCHPRLLNRGPHPLRKPEDLKYHTLLHGDGGVSDRTRSTWASWLRMANAAEVNPRRGLQFDHSTLALEAAADGLGVTLAMPLLAAAELERGDVVVAFPLSLPLGKAYYAVASPASISRPEVSVFHRWLLREARRANRADPIARAERTRKKKRPRR